MILETERLVLEELSTGDEQFIFELMNSPGWIKHIGDRGIKTLKDAINYMNSRLIASYRVNGYGLFKVVLKDSSTPIGLCGLVNRSTLEYPDIGFAFLPDQSGKGYGYESASSILDYAKEVLGIEKVVAITSAENTKSQSLLEKIGLKFDKIIRLPDYDGDNYYYI